MKGISTILAMILIVIITVALIGLTYTFASGLITTVSTGAQNQTSTITTNLQKTVYISGTPTCTNDTTKVNVSFTIKVTGAAGINKELGASIDGADMTGTTYEYWTASPTTLISNSVLSPNKVQGYIMNFSKSATTYKARTITISSPAGDVSYTISSCAY